MNDIGELTASAKGLFPIVLRNVTDTGMKTRFGKEFEAEAVLREGRVGTLDELALCPWEIDGCGECGSGCRDWILREEGTSSPFLISVYSVLS